MVNVFGVSIVVAGGFTGAGVVCGSRLGVGSSGSLRPHILFISWGRKFAYE